ncbi:A24 family peptidase [Kineothrix sp. MB12-C1]|uniref:A24 family peptidase n=1 Tax=Kineothrix sp. MB12-C1 TaxID=3070215 RepID=UPI0027D3205C|nr:prepilin peptidase [Kineothrix sp. MB12-C1]WMC94350.1 prepilin peptidase [Kineothrix sp. MB12-C1]
MCIIFVIFLLLIVSVVMDFLFDKIFNGWILIIIMTGMSYMAWKSGVEGILNALLSMILPFIILYPLFMIGSFGAGDIKLLSAIGSFFTAREILSCVMTAFLMGAVFSFIKMVAEGNFVQRMEYLWSYVCDVFRNREWKLYEEEIQDRKERNKGKIHFALPVLLGAILVKGGWFF